MKRFTVLTVILMALLLLGVSAAAAREQVSLQAQFGHAELVSASCVGPVCEFVFEGSGTVNIMGRVTAVATITQDFGVRPCNPTTGQITFTGETGTISLGESGSVCQGTNPNGLPAFIYGEWEVTGGTGEFSGMTGSGTNFGPITPGQGPVVHYRGTVSH